MVDFTNKTSSGGMWIYIAAGLVVLVVVYAIFAGGGGQAPTGPATTVAEPAPVAPTATD